MLDLPRTITFALAAALCGCSPVGPDGGDTATTASGGERCGGKTCHGCCMFNTCLEQAMDCHGASCTRCFACGPHNCGGCCQDGKCITAPEGEACGAGGGACFSCGPAGACHEGRCATAIGRACVTGQFACTPGSTCFFAQSYVAARCWPECVAEAGCPTGFECVESSIRSRRTCVPVRTASSAWALRLDSYVSPAAPDAALPPRQYQVCFRLAGSTFCDRVVPSGTLISWDRDLARVFTEGELTQVDVDIWMLPAGTEDAPACEGSGCADLASLHTQLAAHTQKPADLRLPAGQRNGGKIIALAAGESGKSTTVFVRLELVR